MTTGRINQVTISYKKSVDFCPHSSLPVYSGHQKTSPRQATGSMLHQIEKKHRSVFSSHLKAALDSFLTTKVCTRIRALAPTWPPVSQNPDNDLQKVS